MTKVTWDRVGYVIGRIIRSSGLWYISIAAGVVALFTIDPPWWGYITALSILGYMGDNHEAFWKWSDDVDEKASEIIETDHTDPRAGCVSRMQGHE